ncbi:hypothetical protein [Streptomyces pactum]|uniref:Uncharacterized protein n=1 Tax=Streptomyces pactum TaxID=68249 RepID=A0A1S6J981_9ACTN|nr:hypothetical protein [Streptomyces pactum]AQS68339.1 hypothetical protein B1H29_16610 [Streptomyces pactum]
MSITQQYLLDTYRARQLGEPAPPAPGAHDWQVVREWHDRRQFQAALAGRPAHGRPVHGRVRRALRRWWSRWPRALG